MRSRWSLLALIICPLSLAMVAARADEGEVTLGLQPGYGFASLGQGAQARSLSAGGGALALSLGVSESLALRLLGSALASPESAGPGGARVTWAATLGLCYALDLLRVVPFFEAGLGVLGTQPAPGPQAALALQVGLGADYLLTRSLALGGAMRYQVALSDPGALPLVLMVGPQLSVKLR